MSLNSFSSGVNTSFSSELNQNFNGGSLVKFYSGTGFDASASTSGSTSVSNSYEFSSITSSNIGSADYVVVDIFVDWSLNSNSGGSNVKLKIESKEGSGSYSTDLDKTIMSHSDGVTGGGVSVVRYVHVLSAGEKSNGVTFKVTGTASVSGTNADASISNVNCSLILLSSQ